MIFNQSPNGGACRMVGGKQARIKELSFHCFVMYHDMYIFIFLLLHVAQSYRIS